MIKEQLDKRLGAPWHVIAGQHYAYEVTHECKNLMHVFIGGNNGRAGLEDLKPALLAAAHKLWILTKEAPLLASCPASPAAPIGFALQSSLSVSESAHTGGLRQVAGFGDRQSLSLSCCHLQTHFGGEAEQHVE